MVQSAVEQSKGLKTYLNYIGGEWRPSSSGSLTTVTNPSNTEDVLGMVQSSTEEDVMAAVEAAETALKQWRSLPAPKRGEFLYKAANILEARLEEVAYELSREQGKPIGEARGETKRGVDLLRYYAGEGMRSVGEVIPSTAPDTLMFTTREPLGVVAVITPWNFPVAIPLWKMCPAIIYGNTVVLKPADLAPITALRIAEIFDEAGLPKGVVNVVTGSGSKLGDPLIKHPAVHGVTFTGSNSVGRHIASLAAEKGIKYQLEMGGKNAAIILPDADLDRAAEIVVSGAMRFAGQKCTATSRAIVHKDVLVEFTEKVKSLVESLALKPATEEGAYLGPVVSEKDRSKVLSYIQLGKDGEGKLVCGGKVPEDGGYKKGYFVEPTVFTDVDPKARIAQEEIFGPVLSLIPAESVDEAIEIANGVKYGLSCSIFTGDLNAVLDYLNKIEVGMVRVNAETAGVELQAPFGGFKESSSHSREQGRAAIEFFTQVKTVTITKK